MRWFLMAAVPVAVVHAVASTDMLRDTDPAQSGYMTNHNLDPKVVGSSAFGIRWKVAYNSLEAFYAKPLVWTPPGASTEMLITTSNQNIIRIIDGMTGALVKMRTLDPPFMASDANCGDIPNTIGITGTPIIDPTTDIMYLYSKGYKGGVKGPAGTINGQYKLYAIQLPGLTDVAGFPVIIDGHSATNDATRYFLGGTVLQRPSLAMVGNIVIGGFGGHCDNFNYTGMLVAVSKTSGVGITNVIAMEASPGAPSPQPTNINVQMGGMAGIWQSGMGIAADSNNHIFFATGNGHGGGGANKNGVPANGHVAISTLDNVAANFAVDPASGVLTQSDYFEPFNYQNLDGGDQDLGSSGISLLDPATFSGGSVKRVAVCGGKNNNVFVMNADDLGGFKNGAGGTDNVLQTIPLINHLFSGIGSYPLEGGYIYFGAVGNDVMHTFKMGLSGAGTPFFTEVAKTALTLAGKSVPTVTSLNGQPGTGIVWVADANNGLLAYKAVPVSGVMVPIPIPSTGRLSNFQRPGFGNGRVYVSNQNTVLALGASGSVTVSPSLTPSSKTSTKTSTKPPTTSTTSSTKKSSSTSSTTSSTKKSSSTSSTTSSTKKSPSTSSTISSTKKSSSRSSTTSSTKKSPSTSSATSSTKKSSSTSSTTSSTKKSSSTSSTKKSSSRSSTTSSKSATSSSSSAPTGPPSTSVTTTRSSSSSITTFVTSTSTHHINTKTTITSTSPPSLYTHVGCYQDLSTGHALPSLFANDSMTPELCKAVVEGSQHPAPFFFLEYHRECYAGSSFSFGSSAVTSVTGAFACTDVCAGSSGAATTGTAFCGGWKMFDLYARSGTAPPWAVSTTRTT